MNNAVTSRRALLGTLALAPAIGLVSHAADKVDFLPANPSTPLTKVPDTLPRGSVVAASGPAQRGIKGLMPRMGDLDLESYQDYLGARGLYVRKIAALAQQRGSEILRAHGIDPTKPSDMPIAEIAALLKDDPIVARAARFGLDNHYDAFCRLRDYYHTHGNYYSDLLAASDRQGPGALELNPGMVAPDYTKHEIHNQVGGYMGDPFAGPIYYYGTLVLNDSANQQDFMFDAIAKNMPLPADGKVRRILENGTGPGQLVTSLKRRFPDAEVWGIDVSGPMVRYAHQRANELGVKVNFAQRLAEANGFPDNYFDIIASSSFHHELTADASAKVFKEAQRSLRPGGIFRPADSGLNGGYETPQAKLGLYMSYRVNHEIWAMEWSDMDRFGAMRATGLKVDPNGAPGGDGGAGVWLSALKLVATKV